MDQLKKNREFIINYFNAMSGADKTRELCEKYTNDQELIAHIEFFEAAFPKYELFIEEIMTEGNKVLIQARLNGTHSGEFNGIPATGRNIDLPFAIRYTMEDGLITDHWLIADQMLLMEQLGVMEPQTTHN
ncbi:ester cyclase [Aurantibacter crassamenti]|uniref:ester cyclase n=1 Tax=Aurantibacter crassamenti TaxID=1837375 RepID=UPI00193AA75F|nr:ester cyclase [Aurantibacter crassamenti]MBM1107826.1 ester cyclase [Aurantibacter crassamenti]